MTEESIDPNACIWKPTMKQKANGEMKELKFPCRFPNKEKTSEICTPCLLGDIFAMQYSQLGSIKQQSAMSDEIMTFLRNMTSDGSLDDLN